MIVTSHTLDPQERLHDEVYRTLHKELKRKRDSKDRVDTQKSFLERRANTMEGCNFCIMTERQILVSWRLSARDAAMSGFLKNTCINVADPVHTYKVPSNYDPLIIDIMVCYLTSGCYKLSNPPELRGAQGASILNKNLTAIIDSTIPIFIHLDVFHIAITMDIPELAFEAMKNLEHAFYRRTNPITIEHYMMFVARLWGVTDSDINMDTYHQIHELRCMVGTYGATMGPIWEVESDDMYSELTDIHGKYHAYAVWHAQTMQCLGKRSRHKLAPFVQKKLDKLDKDSEDEESVKEDG